MECKHCGAQLSIEEELCPYCGQVNEEAAKHQEAMKQYDKEFTQVKQDVIKTTKHLTSFSFFLMAIAAMALLNGVLFYCSANYDEILDKRQQSHINSNKADFGKTLSRYEGEGDYFSMMNYIRENDLNDNPNFEDYGQSYLAARHYTDIYTDVMTLTRTDTGKQIKTDEDCIESISSDLAGLYEIFGESLKELWPEKYAGGHGKAIEGIEEKTRLLLTVQCGLTAEDWAQLPALSDTEKAMLLGRRLGIYE